MIMKHLIVSLLTVAASSGAILAAASSPKKPTPQATASQPTAKAASQSTDEGQRVFEQNCSRCHTAPDGFSSRISGTIVRHMRVRANLSKHDEEELLRFLNP